MLCEDKPRTLCSRYRKAEAGDEVRVTGSGLWERLGMEKWKIVDNSKQDKEINAVEP